MTMNGFETLKRLLQSYYHQDWSDEYDGDPWRAVRDFARSNPDADSIRLQDEIEQILASAMTEAEIRHLVIDELDSAFSPDGDGWAYRDWLSEVARRAERYRTMSPSVTCPACGYVGLVEPLRRPSGVGSRETCRCCGFRSGITDDRQGYTYEQWRQRWTDQGMSWKSRTFPAPEGWDPREQIARLGTDGGSTP